MNIRLDDTFERLSEQFGMSTNHASRIFNLFVPKLAFYFKKLIFFPSKVSVKRALCPFHLELTIVTYNQLLIILKYQFKSRQILLIKH